MNGPKEISAYILKVTNVIMVSKISEEYLIKDDLELVHL